MEYFEYLKKGFEILKLNRSVISDVADDSNATKWSVLTVGLTGVVLGLLIALFASIISPLFGAAVGFGAIVTYPIVYLVSLFVGSGVLYLVAKLFGGQGSYMGLVRAWGLASFVNVLSFIPIVNILVLVWSLVAGVVTLSETQRLSIGKAIGVYVVISVVLGILTLLLSLLFAVSLFSGLAAGALASS